MAPEKAWRGRPHFRASGLRECAAAPADLPPEGRRGIARSRVCAAAGGAQSLEPEIGRDLRHARRRFGPASAGGPLCRTGGRSAGARGVGSGAGGAASGGPEGAGARGILDGSAKPAGRACAPAAGENADCAQVPDAPIRSGANAPGRLTAARALPHPRRRARGAPFDPSRGIWISDEPSAKSEFLPAGPAPFYSWPPGVPRWCA